MPDNRYMTFVYLLSGKAGSGKDAIASILCDEYRFQRLAFADSLKEDFAAAKGVSVDVLHDSELKWAYRPLLIQHATEARAIDIDVYSKAVAAQIGKGRYVISDWRLLAEESYLRKTLKDVTFVTVRVERMTGARARPFLWTSSQDKNHYTETELDTITFDVRIVNDGTIKDLREAIRYQLLPTFSSAFVSGPTYVSGEDAPATSK